MDTNKKYCQIHHFSYTGFECPFCLQDRLSYVIRKTNIDKSSKQNEDNSKKNIDGDKTLKSDDIRDLLSSKFNVGKL